MTLALRCDIGAGPGAVTRGATVQGVSETTTGPAGPEQPSEEQVREYLAQLRSVPAEQIVAEIVSGLLNAAQAKLGRRDARLLIDLSTVLVDQARGYVSKDLATEVDQALAQLRLGQVRAEESAAGRPEPNDLAETPPPPRAGAGEAGPGGQGATPPASPSSGLWVPGRDR